MWRFFAAIGRLLFALVDFIFTALWRFGVFIGLFYLYLIGVVTIGGLVALLGFGLRLLELPSEWELPPEVQDVAPFALAAAFVLFCALVWNWRVKKRHLAAMQGKLVVTTWWRFLVASFAVFQGVIWLLGLALFAYDHPFESPILPAVVGTVALAAAIAGVAFSRGRGWAAVVLVVLAGAGAAGMAYALVGQAPMIDAPASLISAILDLGGCAIVAGAAALGLRKTSTARIMKPVPGHHHSIVRTAPHWGAAGIVAALALVLWSASQSALWQWSVGEEIEGGLRYLDGLEAVNYARGFVRMHPGDGHGYLLLADLYNRQRRSLPAVAALEAYKSMLLAHPVERFREEWGARSAPAERLGAEIKKNIEQRLQSNRVAIFELYRDRSAPVPLLARYKAEDVLRVPARTAAAQAGVLNLDLFADTGVTCLQAQDCRSAFRDVSLITAVEEGVAAVPLSAKCCSLSLDDPDLVDIDIEPLRSRIAASAGLANFLAITSRMLLKQMYLWNFVVNTSAAND